MPSWARSPAAGFEEALLSGSALFQPTRIYQATDDWVGEQGEQGVPRNRLHPTHSSVKAVLADGRVMNNKWILSEFHQLATQWIIRFARHFQNKGSWWEMSRVPLIPIVLKCQEQIRFNTNHEGGWGDRVVLCFSHWKRCEQRSVCTFASRPRFTPALPQWCCRSCGNTAKDRADIWHEYHECTLIMAIYGNVTANLIAPVAGKWSRLLYICSVFCTDFHNLHIEPGSNSGLIPSCTNGSALLATLWICRCFVLGAKGWDSGSTCWRWWEDAAICISKYVHVGVGVYIYNTL